MPRYAHIVPKVTMMDGISVLTTRKPFNNPIKVTLISINKTAKGRLMLKSLTKEANITVPKTYMDASERSNSPLVNTRPIAIVSNAISGDSRRKSNMVRFAKKEWFGVNIPKNNDTIMSKATTKTVLSLAIR